MEIYCLTNDKDCAVQQERLSSHVVLTFSQHLAGALKENVYFHSQKPL